MQWIISPPHSQVPSLNWNFTCHPDLGYKSILFHSTLFLLLGNCLVSSLLLDPPLEFLWYSHYKLDITQWLGVVFCSMSSGFSIIKNGKVKNYCLGVFLFSPPAMHPISYASLLHLQTAPCYDLSPFSAEWSDSLSLYVSSGPLASFPGDRKVEDSEEGVPFLAALYPLHPVFANLHPMLFLSTVSPFSPSICFICLLVTSQLTKSLNVKKQCSTFYPNGGRILTSVKGRG